MKKAIFIIFVFTFCFMGCSSMPSDIKPSYIPASRYIMFDCNQLAMELERVRAKLKVISDDQKGESRKDKLAIAGSLLFIPLALFTIGHDHKHELAELKGQQESILEAQILKRCTMKSGVKNGGNKRTKEGSL